MSDDYRATPRTRALEDEYFRKKDRELIEKVRRAAEEQQALLELGRSVGLDDPRLAQELQELGFTVETVRLLPLVPILQMAWAEGGITKPERELILRLARSRGVDPGSASDAQLAAWLENRPSEDVFTRATRLIRAMFDAGYEQAAHLKADDLIRYCEEIASASGGIFGIGRISAEERALLASITAELTARRT